MACPAHSLELSIRQGQTRPESAVQVHPDRLGLQVALHRFRTELPAEAALLESTKGQISSLANELSGSNYWMINANTYFGNSGGGVYLADSHQLIGVFSKIYTNGKGNPVVIPHMGLCTPIGLVHDWLADKDFGHLLEYEVAVAAPGK